MKTGTLQNLIAQFIAEQQTPPEYQEAQFDWIGDLVNYSSPEKLGQINTTRISESTEDSFKVETLKYHSSFDKQVWFSNSDGSYLFELEVPRYSKEDISVTIEDDGVKTLVIFAEKKVGNNVSHCFTEKYDVPDSQNLDLENSLVKVENGLLSIAFPRKNQAAKTIKIL